MSSQHLFKAGKKYVVQAATPSKILCREKNQQKMYPFAHTTLFPTMLFLKVHKNLNARIFPLNNNTSISQKFTLFFSDHTTTMTCKGYAF